MAAEGKEKKNSVKPITEDQRFNFIGFEVFPGKPKDLFKSDKEKDKFVNGVLAKREKGETLRDECTLLEERVSFIDRLVLTVASVLIFAALFVPWYSAYNEIVEEEPIPVVSEEAAVMADSAMLAAAGDTLAAGGQAAVGEDATVPAAGSQEGQEIAEGETGEAVGAATDVVSASAAEEVIHGYVAKRKIHKEYSRVSGIGSVAGLGSMGSYVFSSGAVVIITAIIFILYALMCIGAPAYTLYGLYGMKGDSDQKALRLKKMLRLNWLPLILFVLALILSFFGAEYGFDSESVFTSLGRAYGPGVFLGTLSWGIIISMSAFILVAVKGVEI